MVKFDLVKIEFEGVIKVVTPPNYIVLLIQALDKLMELEKVEGFTPLQDNIHSEIQDYYDNQIIELFDLDINDFYHESWQDNEYLDHIVVTKF